MTIYPDDPARWILPEVAAFQARQRPEKTFVRMVDGDAISFAEVHAAGELVAGFLHHLGVDPGDRVAVLARNSLDLIRAWLGLGRLGAAFVVLNTELKGAFLEHQLVNCAARVAIVGADLLPVLIEIAPRLPKLETVIIADPDSAEAPADLASAGWRVIDFAGWRDAERWQGPTPRAHDIAAVMYTSGTTGPAKGVLMPHAHCFLYGYGAADNLAVTADDVYYIVLPLFHANGLLMQLYCCLITGATAVVRRRFSATAWLDDVRRYGATITNSLGVVSAFVVDTPPRPEDRDHKLRLILCAPNPAEHVPVWHERFGVPAVSSGFGMTENNIISWGGATDSKPGSAGKPYARFFEVSIRDPDTDAELGPGQTGEITSRPKLPWTMMAGYLGLPDKTMEAWRNLWFHTGDAGYIDEDGNLFFVDRIKDCIRRRGENISSWEVEQAVLRLEGVAEVAAYAVAADIAGGEDEVMLAVVAAPGARLTPQQIAAHTDSEVPRFARPRFIDIVAALPKTPTEKVRKAELRKTGVSAETWDREKA